MIPPNQGSNLFQNTIINMTPRDNLYISVWEDPNETYQDCADREGTIVFGVIFSYPECETVTRGIMYRFAMLNSPQTSHLGKLSISPTL